MCNRFQSLFLAVGSLTKMKQREYPQEIDLKLADFRVLKAV